MGSEMCIRDRPVRAESAAHPDPRWRPGGLPAGRSREGQPALGARAGSGPADRHPAIAGAHEFRVLQRPLAVVQLSFP